VRNGYLRHIAKGKRTLQFRFCYGRFSVFKRGSQGDPLFVVVDFFGESELCKTIGFAIACATDICGISQKESARFSSDSATGDFRFLKEDRKAILFLLLSISLVNQNCAKPVVLP